MPPRNGQHPAAKKKKKSVRPTLLLLCGLPGAGKSTFDDTCRVPCAWRAAVGSRVARRRSHAAASRAAVAFLRQPVLGASAAAFRTWRDAAAAAHHGRRCRERGAAIAALVGQTAHGSRFVAFHHWRAANEEVRGLSVCPPRAVGEFPAPPSSTSRSVRFCFEVGAR